jgi:chromosome condensin MukBEF MukE localization factor
MAIEGYFYKWKETFTLADNTVQTETDKLVTEVICRFGAPYHIHTSQGRVYVSDLFFERKGQNWSYEMRKIKLKF